MEESSYRLVTASWGRGFGTEGSLALIDEAFQETGTKRMVAETMSVTAPHDASWRRPAYDSSGPSKQSGPATPRRRTRRRRVRDRSLRLGSPARTSMTNRGAGNRRTGWHHFPEPCGRETLLRQALLHEPTSTPNVDGRDGPLYAGAAARITRSMAVRAWARTAGSSWRM